MLDLLNLQWLNHNLQSKFSHEILDFDKILSLLYNRVLYANFDQFLAFYNENRGHTQILEKKVDFFLKLTPSTTVKLTLVKNTFSKSCLNFHALTISRDL